MAVILQVDQILKGGPRGLGISPAHFICPYCRHAWLRGGHKEGFVKAAANNHVAGCREIVLFEAGYVMGPRWGTVIPISEAEALPHWTRWRRGIKALIASRRRAGLVPAATLRRIR